MNGRMLLQLGLCVIVCLCTGCREKSFHYDSVVTTNSPPPVDKYAPYVEGNKKIMQWEKEEMELFIKRYHWNMTRTGTGLYIEILNPGKGALIRPEEEVRMKYCTFLLSGELIYNSSQDGIKVFTVDKSQEIDGLHEAVKMLRPGAKARLVIPSYLAHGVAGDGDKVVGRMPLAMIIEIIS